MRRAVFASLAAAFAVAASGAAAAPALCHLQMLGEFPVSMHDGVPMVDATVDGHPVRLIVDSGSFTTVLFPDAVYKMGLHLRDTRAQAFGIGGAAKLYDVQVKSFRLGTLVEHNANILVTGDAPGAQGLLGAQFLTQADVEFDLPHGEVRFFTPLGCKGDEVVYWGQAYAVADMIAQRDNSIEVEVHVNGARILALIDSGTTESVLTPGSAQLAKMGPEQATRHKEGEWRGAIGPALVAESAVVVPTFSFGAETIRNAVLRVADLFGRERVKNTNDLIPVPIAEQPEMLLGADFLAAHRVFVAREQHRIYVSYEGGRVFRPPTASPAKSQATPAY